MKGLKYVSVVAGFLTSNILLRFKAVQNLFR